MIHYPEKIRIVTAFPEDYADEFVVCLGQAALPDTLAPAKVLRLPRPAEAGAAVVRATPHDLAHGLLFVVDPACDAREGAAVAAVELAYLHAYYRDVVLPNRSSLAPAADGIRPPAVPEIVRIISKLENIPTLFRSPLAQKLADQKLGAPVLLLLPGPSLTKAGPRLRELAVGHLVVAVSRTLGFCLKHGVTPDFVVQQDTFLQQRHFFEPMPPLPETTLVALSISPVATLAARFRGVFFMDSFDLKFLNNPYRLRENGLSTLMGCLGLAECLHAPYAVVSGADLSSPGKHHGNRYFDSRADAAAFTPPASIRVDEGIYLLRDRAGKGVSTTLMYLAVAEEAKAYARAIGAGIGTRFYVLDETGVLSPDLFHAWDPALAATAAPLDRRVLRGRIDAALAQSERIKMAAFKVDCQKTLEVLDQNILFLDACRVNKTTDGLDNSPIYRFAGQERDFRLPDDPGYRLAFALRLAAKWRRVLGQARNLAQAYQLARYGERLPLVCLPRETAEATDRLERLFPGFAWDVRPIAGPADGAPAGTVLSHAQLHKTLPAFPVAFVTAAARAAYDYHFDVYGADNLYYLDGQDAG